MIPKERFDLDEMLAKISKCNLKIVMSNSIMFNDIKNRLEMGTGGRHLMEIAILPKGSTITKEHIRFLDYPFMSVVQELVNTNGYIVDNEIITEGLLKHAND